MAELDDLIPQVGDAKLRRQLEEAAVELRRRKKFGLVFEQHMPETTIFPSGTLQKGAVVMIRTEPSNKTRYVVDSVTKAKASISAGGEARTLPIADLLVVKPFGEPLHPVLRPFGEAVVRDPDKPFHTVVNGENFHALQLLLFAYEGQVDCIYIDPPYNTGAGDWKYNNDYVDAADSWRPSKWLSMMDQRLRLARRLLKPDTGVLVVTIDEHEVGHLSVLLEEMFPSARRQLVTIVNSSAGNTRGGFWRVEEYAIFCFPPGVRPNEIADDLLSDESKRPRARGRRTSAQAASMICRRSAQISCTRSRSTRSRGVSPSAASPSTPAWKMERFRSAAGLTLMTGCPIRMKNSTECLSCGRTPGTGKWGRGGTKP